MDGAHRYALGRRHPLAAQICLEQIWTYVVRPQGVRQGRRTSKIRRDLRITCEKCGLAGKFFTVYRCGALADNRMVY